MKEKTNEATKKFVLKETISVGALLGFVGWIIYTMTTNSLVVWMDWTDAGFKLILGIIAFTAFMIFGWDRAGVMAVVMTILRVVFDPKMSNEAKLQFIKEAIEKLIGIGLTIQNEMEQEIKKSE